MNSRRSFLKLSTGSAALAAGVRAQTIPVSTATLTTTTTGAQDRAAWVRLAQKLAHPVLSALAQRRLKATMPVEASPKSKDRPAVTHLEALGRVLSVSGGANAAS